MATLNPTKATIKTKSRSLYFYFYEFYGVVVNSMLMNDLNRYCQKLGIPFPVYQTTSEGFAHSLRFRSTVTVGERSFTSNIFGNKKSAEQDVAKLALEHLRTEEEALSTPTRLAVKWELLGMRQQQKTFHRVSHKFNLIYVITKCCLLFVYDLETTSALQKSDKSRYKKVDHHRLLHTSACVLSGVSSYFYCFRCEESILAYPFLLHLLRITSLSLLHQKKVVIG